MALVNTSSTRRRLVSSVLLRKKLVHALALEESLPCVLPISYRRVMRQSEKQAQKMSLSDKAAQVAMFQLVM
jgi:hypothetical protein